jgi:16S rRNA (uracil1498-N3)-methyltransferase
LELPPKVDRRFYSPPPLVAGRLVLAGPEAHHLTTVLRAAAGDTVELFDGQGRVASATVTAVRKRDVELLVDFVREEPRAVHALTIATAVPKGERFDWLVEKATELGVTRLVPLTTQRSSVDPRDSKLDRLRQLVVSAGKQSGRNWLLELAPVTPWEEFLRGTATGQRVLIAAPGGRPWGEVMAETRAADTVVAIGPEGGWTDSELELARSVGAEIVSLGPHILRIETAVLAVAAAWRLHAPHT